MIRVELPALIGRLNETCRVAMEASAALCISRQGAEITPAHLLFKLLETPLSDVRRILDRAGIKAGVPLHQRAQGDCTQLIGPHVGQRATCRNATGAQR